MPNKLNKKFYIAERGVAGQQTSSITGDARIKLHRCRSDAPAHASDAQTASADNNM
jgi:hypothetical protein